MASKTDDILTSVDQKKSSNKGLVVGIVIATVVAIGAGAGIGVQFSSLVTPAKTEKKLTKEKKKAVAKNYVDDRIVKALPAIVTNLATPENAWIRMEASIIIKGEEKGVDVLAAKIAEDTLAYLKTLSLSDIEGASGLAYLRGDLNERATTRSAGRVLELVIGTLVVE